MTATDRLQYLTVAFALCGVAFLFSLGIFA